MASTSSTGAERVTGMARSFIQGMQMRIKSVLLAAVVALAGLTGQAWAADDEGPSAKCLMCHAAEHDKMARSRHANVADGRNFGCVGCHGMSEEHADNPVEKAPERKFGKGGLDPAEATEVCMACHVSTGKTLIQWAGSTHPVAGVACNNCHTIHADKDKVFNKAAQSAVCFTCHKDTRMASLRPFRHPLQEGKMACTDCHSPHGSAGPHLIKRDSTNMTCYQCHAEKRGPFVQNHQPVSEDCATCHNPHGSNIDGMLKARDPILCNQCHTPHGAGGMGAVGGQPGVFPPAVSPQTQSAITPLSGGINTVNVWQARSCLNCHTQVHGSNNPGTRAPVPSNLFR